MSRLETVAREHGAYFTGPELMAAEFPPPRWAVPGLIPEGLTILAGAPKLGKSWLSLAICLDVAGGKPVLGGIRADIGETIYFGLEDTPRRLQGRLYALTKDTPPKALTAVTVLPSLPQAIELLDEHIAEHPDVRLVVIDVLGKVRPMTAPGRPQYEADYEVIGAFKAFADRHGIAVILVTHTRKMGDEDVFATVTGSTGLTGAADTTLVLRRPRGEKDAILSVTGRDVFEADYAVRFDHEMGRWNLVGQSLEEAAQAAERVKVTAGVGERSSEILAYVAEHPDGVRAADVERALELPDARRYLARLADAGRIERPDRGLYKALSPLSHVSHSHEETPGQWDNGTHGTQLLEGDSCIQCGTGIPADTPMLTCSTCQEGW